MPNYYGRLHAPMIQPTKDELRNWLWEAQEALKSEKMRRRGAEARLQVATRQLGNLVLEGKIAISAERLGQLVLDIACQAELEEANIELAKAQAKLLV